MKKITFLALALFAGACIAYATPVTLSIAQTVAKNFYTQNYSLSVANLSLTYTEKDQAGNPVFYVFNVNQNDGFVIVSAEDAGMPIIGYSNKGSYTVPQAGNNVDFWMQSRKAEILNMRTKGYQPNAEITTTWTSYINNIRVQNSPNVNRLMGIFPSNSQYLVQSTWNQSPNYNAMCPGGSVTGCVATAMSQIMRYWDYPAHGLGSSSYNDVQPQFSQNYGIQAANYGTTVYNWGNMPLNLGGNNSDVATINYDAGVSVQMDYSPSGSGAWVILSDGIAAFSDSACAQRSYTKYFGYNPATIQGLKQSNYSLAAWQNLLENDLNNNRPIQYVGTDPVNGGHTWVCDGYDFSTNFHMNWGWGGADNGWYNVNTLNPGPYNFSQNHQALIGIEPRPIMALLKGSPQNACVGTTVQFNDQSLVPNVGSPVTAWKWTFPGGTPSTSNVQNPTVTYNTPGSYNVSLKVTNLNGSDSVTEVAYITISNPNALPLVQGFEGSFPPAQWSINNPNGHSTTWAQYTGVGGRGQSTHCMYYNNCSGGITGNYDQIYTPDYNFSAVVNPMIYFDVAYAPYDNTYSDTLAVYYSLDCGKTFTRIYLKGGMTLNTTGGLQAHNGGGAHVDGNGCFVPLNANWRTDTVKIPAIAGQSGVLFSFENRSGNGTNLYVDNVNIPAAPLGTFDPTEDYSLNIYPNPNNGNFQISFNTQQDKTYDVSIYNMLGQEVVHDVVQNSTSNYLHSVDLGRFGKGIYSVILRNGTQQTVKKVAVY